MLQQLLGVPRVSRCPPVSLGGPPRWLPTSSKSSTAGQEKPCFLGWHSTCTIQGLSFPAPIFAGNLTALWQILERVPILRALKKLQNISRNRKTSNLFENDAFLGSPVLSWLGSILSSFQPSLKWVRGRGHCRSVSIIHQDCGTMIADLNSDFIFQCDFTNILWINFKGEAQRV